MTPQKDHEAFQLAPSGQAGPTLQARAQPCTPQEQPLSSSRTETKITTFRADQIVTLGPVLSSPTPNRISSSAKRIYTGQESPQVNPKYVRKMTSESSGDIAVCYLDNGARPPMPDYKDDQLLPDPDRIIGAHRATNGESREVITIQEH